MAKYEPIYEVMNTAFNKRWYPQLIGGLYVYPLSYVRMRELTFEEYLDLIDPTHDAIGQMNGSNE